MKLLTCLVAATLCALPAHAFNPPKDTAGALTIEIADPGEVKALGQPVAVPVTLTNASDAPLSGALAMAVTDDWRVEGEASRPFALAAKATQTLAFTVVAGNDSYAALYPVHARATLRSGEGAPLTAHAVLLVNVTGGAVASNKKAGFEPALRVPKRGVLRLDEAAPWHASIAVHDQPVAVMPAGWHGHDETTGASMGFTEIDRGEQRRALGVHPPYKKGWGESLVDWRVTLPAAEAVFFESATAIRDSDSKREGASDGVEFKVQVSEGAAFKTLFERFSAAQRWQPLRVDLSAYAGREVTLRLVTGPGPAHNTSCDSSFWAAPILRAGPPPAVESPPLRAARRDHALAAARAALGGRVSAWAWMLESEAGRTGAAVAAGPNGIVDAFFAFTDGKREVVFDGFALEIDGVPVASGPAGWACEAVEQRFAAARGVLTHRVLKGDQPVAVQAEVWAQAGALRVAFAMPGAIRDARGEPRFTALSIGPASEKARRVYAGFGNVIQDPGRFDLRAGGFTLSTRHVGMDFANGLSLVQASDLFPDMLHVDPDQQRYALVAHHDATLSFIPSAHGAFAAARVYRGLAGFQPAGGVSKLLGRMCLDQWGGDYRKAADDLEKAGRYGLNDAIFVKHVWQRWGYDYRLPEIYPPSGSLEDFRAMAGAAKRQGMLFCPHDNYIDYYPDADGFSYDHIIFNRDGTPQKAWFNKGRQALSYRWLPTAFFPALEKNLQLMNDGFAPTSCFVDVFSAIPPMDFYDRQGRFYPKMVTAERWGAAFDRIREVLGDHAPTLSEAGTDALIGHLDGGQSDHEPWLPELKTQGHGADFRWRMPAGDAERVPWHDMASHGAFVLFAGGLGGRYDGGDDPLLHGYASDDYLSLTALGGRNPMCDGPFSRPAVMTYWLLHGLCAELARAELLAHEFADDDIHRQSVRFSNGFAHVNRGATDWQVAGQTLPRYGLVARAGEQSVSIARRAGVISALATSPGELFADARPPAASTPCVRTRVMAVDDLGGGNFRVRIEWVVLRPVAPELRAFMHFAEDRAEGGESIAFQGSLKLDPAMLAQPGTQVTESVVALPATARPGSVFALRYGLFDPRPGGDRLRLDASLDSGRRAKGGLLHVDAGANNPLALRWENEPADPNLAARAERVNTVGKVVDFGPVATNGAFRLRHRGDAWELTPLPDSHAFNVTLDLAQLGAAGKRVESVSAVDIAGQPLGAVSVRQDGARADFAIDGRAFSYRLRLAR